MTTNKAIQVENTHDEAGQPIQVFTVTLVTAPDFSFNGLTGADAMHETLCKAIYERDDEALEQLESQVLNVGSGV